MCVSTSHASGLKSISYAFLHFRILLRFQLLADVSHPKRILFSHRHIRIGALSQIVFVFLLYHHICEVVQLLFDVLLYSVILLILVQLCFCKTQFTL